MLPKRFVKAKSFAQNVELFFELFLGALSQKGMFAVLESALLFCFLIHKMTFIRKDTFSGGSFL
jgi:hypothetical protein